MFGAKNKCGSCRHVWTPKDGALERFCPECKSPYVSLTGNPFAFLWYFVLLAIVGGAAYLVLGGGAKEVADTAQSVLGEGDSKGPRPKKTKPKKTAEPRPAEDEDEDKDKDAPPAAEADRKPAADVVVLGKGAGGQGLNFEGEPTYLVSGSVENRGGAAAEDVVVRATLIAAIDREVARVEAKAEPATLGPGDKATFRLEYTGEHVNDVSGFRLEVDWKRD